MKISALVILPLVCLLASCQPQGKAADIVLAPTKPAGTTLASPSLPTPNAEQSREAIVAGLLAIALKASHMEVTTVQEDGSIAKTVVEFLPPDRKYISGDGAEYIVVGGKVYMKTAEKDWFIAPMSASLFVTDPPTGDGIAGTVSDARVLRKETLDGKEIWVYGYTSTTQWEELTLVSKAELWVSLDDGLPVKYITDGDTIGTSTGSDGSSKMITARVINTTLIDFNSPIKIEAPIQ
jgi:hypothetical protein